MKLFSNPVGILLLVVLGLFGCKKKTQPPEKPLTYVAAYSISVPGSSGLDFTYDKRGFWVASDETSKIYKLNADGNVVKTLKVDGYDLEAVTVVNDSVIAVVLERTRELVMIDTSGKEIRRKKLKLKGERNSGLEGITFNPLTGHFYVLNEKNPSLLIELNDEFEVISIDTLKFSKDVSGIFYDETDNVLWILSDENQLVVITDLNGKPLKKMNISVVQPEGIAVDKKKNRLYIVSDSREALYVYDIN